MSTPFACEVREITSIGEWLTWREHDLTASRIPALWDSHPYMTREDLAGTMRGTSGSGAGALPADNPAMRRGRIWEPAAAAAIGEERPDWRLTKATTYHRLPQLRLGCTPDYWVDDLARQVGRGLIQIKTAAPRVWDQWRGRPPTGYFIQTLTEMLVCDVAWGWLVVMVMSPSFPIHFFPVARHAAAEARILKGVTDWWAAFDKGEIAPAGARDAIIAELDDGSYLDLSGDNELPSLLAERAELSVSRRTAEKRLDEIDSTIKARMGQAATAWLPGWQLAFKSHTRREIFLPEKVIRTLRIKASDDAEEVA